MIHFEYLFGANGNGAFRADTDIYGNDPTKTLSAIEPELRSGTDRYLTSAAATEHTEKISEITANREAQKFIDRYLPTGTTLLLDLES